MKKVFNILSFVFFTLIILINCSYAGEKYTADNLEGVFVGQTKSEVSPEYCNLGVHRDYSNLSDRTYTISIETNRKVHEFNFKIDDIQNQLINHETYIEFMRNDFLLQINNDRQQTINFSIIFFDNNKKLIKNIICS